MFFLQDFQLNYRWSYRWDVLRVNKSYGIRIGFVRFTNYGMRFSSIRLDRKSEHKTALFDFIYTK